MSFTVQPLLKSRMKLKTVGEHEHISACAGACACTPTAADAIRVARNDSLLIV